MDKNTLLDEGMKKWIAGVARKRAWQLPDMEVDDLIQEGYVVFSRCRDRFEGALYDDPKEGKRPFNRREFMTFFQRAFNNHLTDLQRKGMRFRTQCPTFTCADPDIYRSSAADPGMAGFVDILLSAPSEVLQVFGQLAKEGHIALATVYRDLYRLSLKEPHKRSLRKVSINEQLCEAIGVDPQKVNVHQQLLDLLKNA